MIPIHVEIWICSRLLSRDKESFTKRELTACIKKEFSDIRPGISTHISSVCVANKQLNHPNCYNYLISLGSGEYRIFTKGDFIHPSKIGGRIRPQIADIPEGYRYLVGEQLDDQMHEEDYQPLAPKDGIIEGRHPKRYSIRPVDYHALKESEKEAIGRTMLMMAYNPSCARIFSKKANAEIKNLIYEMLDELPKITNQEEFNRAHKDVVNRIVKDIKNERANRKSADITYGQAQKGLNVFLKVYVDWANLPTPAIASVLRPLLHCPLDSVVMREIKRIENPIYRDVGRPPCSLRSITSYDQYMKWQYIIDEIIKRESCDKRTIVDVIWYLESLKKKNG